jgi:hypothetical protein
MALTPEEQAQQNEILKNTKSLLEREHFVSPEEFSQWRDRVRDLIFNPPHHHPDGSSKEITPDLPFYQRAFRELFGDPTQSSFNPDTSNTEAEPMGTEVAAIESELSDADILYKRLKTALNGRKVKLDFVDAGKEVDSVVEEFREHLRAVGQLNEASEAALALAASHLLKDALSNWPERQKFGEESELINRIWVAGYKEYQEKKEANTLGDEATYFSGLIVDLQKPLAGGGRWTDASDIEGLFKQTYTLDQKLNKAIEDENAGELEEIDGDLEKLKTATQATVVATNVSATNILHARLLEKRNYFHRLVHQKISNVDQLAARLKDFGQEGEFTKYVTSLNLLAKKVGALRDEDISSHNVSPEDKQEIEDLLAIVNKGSGFLKDKAMKDHKEVMTAIHYRAAGDAEVILGQSTAEPAGDFWENDVTLWMEWKHEDKWRAVQHYWKMAQQSQQLGNMDAFSRAANNAAVRKEWDVLEAYFIKALGDLDKNDVSYLKQLNLLDVQINRLQSLRAVIGEPDVVVTSSSVPSFSEYDATEFAEFGKEIIEAPVSQVLGRLITNDFPGGEVQKWRRAIEKRVEILKEQGHEEIAVFLDEALLMYLFGVWVKDQSIDIDRIASFPNASLGDVPKGADGKAKGFAQADGRNAYTRYRNTPLFEDAIQPLLDRMDEYLDTYYHPELGEEGADGINYATSSGDWDSGRKLPVFCHEDLYNGVLKNGKVLLPPDEDYKKAIDALVADVPEDQRDEKRAEFIEFLTKIALYESSSQDKRGDRSNLKLGLGRSAVKHRNASVFAWEGAQPPPSWLASRSYKLKNAVPDALNNCCYLWHTLPPDMIIDKFDPRLAVKNQARLREKIRKEQPLLKDEQKVVQSMRYRTTQAILKMAIHHQFGQGEAWHKIEEMRWTPDNISSGMPSIKDFHKWQILNAKGKPRFPDLSANNYTQTMTALGTMFETASTCWENDISAELSKLNQSDFGDRISKEIGDFGTKLAMALSFAIPLGNVRAKPDDPPEVRAEIVRMHHASKHMFKTLQATISIYAVYLLSQIEITGGVKNIAKSMDNKKYRDRYKEALSRINKYLIGNGSMDNGYKDHVDGGSTWIHKDKDIGFRLNDRIVADISDTAFKKKASVEPLGDAIDFNLMMQTFRDNPLTDLTVEELVGHHYMPFRGAASTSVHDD